jgi:hypothetical protein
MFGVVVIFGAVDVIGIHYFNVFYNCYVVLMLVYKKKNYHKIEEFRFLEFVVFILRKFLHTKEKSKAYSCVFDDNKHHFSWIGQ